MINKSKLVRDTCRWVCESSQNVQLDLSESEKLISKFSYTSFNDFEHHNISEDPEVTLLFMFTLDSLNFCFWPLEGFEYEHLAANVKQFICKNNNLDKLLQMQENQLIADVFGGVKVPLADERARLLREMSSILKQNFKGSAMTVVQLANKSAVSLLNILTSNFPNFQDHSIYKGHQIHFYKRAQILIGDIYSKFEGKGLGQFYDIGELTMFPDYRVPQILNEYGILKYSKALQDKIENKIEIASGSVEQIEIRAASVIAVEEMKRILGMKGRQVHSIEVDWFLWEEGERNLKNICPHHRTMTIFY